MNPNLQLVRGGPAVNMPVSIAGYGPTNIGADNRKFSVGDSNGNYVPNANFVISCLGVPAAGTSLSSGPFVFTNTGAIVNFNGHPYQLVSVQAVSNAPLGTNFSYVQGPTDNTAFSEAHTLFDIVDALTPVAIPALTAVPELDSNVPTIRLTAT